MPIVRIDMLAGRTREAKDALIASVTRAVVESIGCPLDAVQVLLYEVEKDDWARGGVTHAQRAAAEPKKAP